MTHAEDIMINAIITAAEANDEIQLKKVCVEKGVKIHDGDDQDHNAAFLLGKRGNESACLLFEKNGGKALDFSCGAAFANNTPFLDKLLQHFSPKIQNKNHYNYNNLLAQSAAQGGHLALVKSFLSKINVSTDRDYNAVAAAAAEGGHREVAELILLEIKPPQKLDYNQIARKAAFGGQYELVKYFLSKVLAPVVPDYNQAGEYAAMGGHQALALSLLCQVAAPEQRDYNKAAKAAVWRGFQDVADQLLSQIKAPANRDYKGVATTASKRGYDDIYEFFTDKSKKQEPVIEKLLQQLSVSNDTTATLFLSEMEGFAAAGFVPAMMFSNTNSNVNQQSAIQQPTQVPEKTEGKKYS